MPEKIRILLTLVAFSLAVAAGCSREGGKNAPAQSERITVAISPWPGSSPIYIARDKGFFGGEGLAVTLQPVVSGHLALDAVLSGKADVGTASDTPIARAVVDGRPLAVLATISEIERGILIIARKDKGISVPGDLRGKRIGCAVGSSAEFFLHVFLTTSLINPRDVRVVDLPPDKGVAALLSGELDAVTTWAPHTILLREKLGDGAVIFHDPSIYTQTWNIAVKQESVKSHPEHMKKFLRALAGADEFIARRPAEARAICSKNIGTEGPLFEKEWQDYHFALKLEQSLILNLEDQARWMIKREAGQSRRPPNFLEFIHTDALKAVRAEAVTIVGR